MTIATKSEQLTTTHTAGLIADAGPALSGLGTRILERLAAFGERSFKASAASRFAELNALSDEELAARGLTRDGLALKCFGPGIFL